MAERKKGSAVIELKDVHKYYRLGDSVVKAVDGIDVKINRGDFVAIVGPSGSGKSTAMNMVGALDIATKGDIFLDGVNIEHLPESVLAQIRGRKIGFIFQTFNLVPTLTALENVMLPMMFQRISLKERQARATQLLEEIGMRPRLNHLPKELSGGERQRVAIARALANDPEVILADEPTGNLDSKRGEEVVEMLKKLSKQGKTIIMVTHDMEKAKYADKIYRLKDGKIVNR
ncbi:macrolide ABC transporter ATP-binding protein [Candidatus Pacearchaeota archaeon RBG_13_36_9]|nr:MAG: macrolide ABC transporter ATP-binding protein [Candidatus Pacearchaeota archaeon RBG_13_36_9]